MGTALAGVQAAWEASVHAHRTRGVAPRGMQRPRGRGPGRLGTLGPLPSRGEARTRPGRGNGPAGRAHAAGTPGARRGAVRKFQILRASEDTGRPGGAAPPPEGAVGPAGGAAEGPGGAGPGLGGAAAPLAPARPPPFSFLSFLCNRPAPPPPSAAGGPGAGPAPLLRAQGVRTAARRVLSARAARERRAPSAGMPGRGPRGPRRPPLLLLLLLCALAPGAPGLASGGWPRGPTPRPLSLRAPPPPSSPRALSAPAPPPRSRLRASRRGSRVPGAGRGAVRTPGRRCLAPLGAPGPQSGSRVSANPHPRGPALPASRSPARGRGGPSAKPGRPPLPDFSSPPARPASVRRASGRQLLACPGQLACGFGSRGCGAPRFRAPGAPGLVGPRGRGAAVRGRLEDREPWGAATPCRARGRVRPALGMGETDLHPGERFAVSGPECKGTDAGGRGAALAGCGGSRQPQRARRTWRRSRRVARAPRPGAPHRPRPDADFSSAPSGRLHGRGWEILWPPGTGLRSHSPAG